jgi:DNA recombination protein Rad52
VKSREGGRGTSLSYIEAHDAIRTANEIFGIGNWQYRVKELVPLGDPEPVKKEARSGFRAGYRAVVEVQIGKDGGAFPLVFSDVGYGDSIDYSGSYITVQELAMKEAVSDGVKRALKNLGDQFGLSLYDKEARKELEGRAKLANGSDASLKKAVWAKAKEALGEDGLTAAKIAKHFGVKTADLQERSTLLTILELS